MVRQLSEETEMAEDSDAHDQLPLDIESQITTAMQSRVSHFKQQSDSLTFEGVRRLLEKDLGLETYDLDVHKRFIKQCLVKCLDGADDDNDSKTSGEMGEKGVTRGAPVLLKKDVKDSEDEEKMGDSPVMGLLTEHKTAKSESEKTNDSKNKEVLSKIMIKKAIRKRAAYVKANSEKITMAGLRRLLEEDLKLVKYTLDTYKEFISQQLDEALESHEVSGKKPATNVMKNVKKNSYSKASKRVSSKENSDSSDSEGDEEEEEEEEEEVKPRKKNVPKGKTENSDAKKRKRPAKESNISSKKQRKGVKTISEENSDAEDGGDASEDGHSEPSVEKPVKKKEVSTPAYGKRVEHLKSVIKSCGMSVPPSIYKKVKQVPENEREAQLIKELEQILSREGLSANPSEKEIKEVRKSKERAKELEGIDMSNIVQSSRRRSTTSFIPPPRIAPPKIASPKIAPRKPKILVESDGDDVKDADEEKVEDTDKENVEDADKEKVVEDADKEKKVEDADKEKVVEDADKEKVEDDKEEEEQEEEEEEEEEEEDDDDDDDDSESEEFNEDDDDSD
ncbi:troponin T, skeletal muscle isoform X1 [Quercus lobata]|uniref:troponin T, skeletal muscle isoform X1 n=2 Tax=Quercus lobata TaxID=97700 RepID=UPI001244EB1D|nr:troponin T, skeletal muscle isoform X1 [Quercus lobata]